MNTQFNLPHLHYALIAVNCIIPYFSYVIIYSIAITQVKAQDNGIIQFLLA